jgi:polysaccharide export outer membrane protein
MARTMMAVACTAAVAGLLFLSPRMSGAWPSEGGDGAESIVSSSLDPSSSSLPAAHAATSTGLSKERSSLDLQYRIGPEDVLRVSVWENKELTQDVVVRPDGKISLPLIQDVQAEGLTAGELADVIHRKLQDFMKVPQVAVIVTQVNAPKIFVIGNVQKPGPYPLRGEMSVLQALSLAGGFTEFASVRNIAVVRRDAGKQQVRKVNYKRLIEEQGEGNYLLRPGDTIVVP